jgi:DNA-binding NtrC family response regulator
VVHKAGKVEMADCGTLFLDEIGEMPGELQVKLLRLIQQGELEKVGATSVGLPVAHQIMTQMGGTLRAQCNSGKGMTFSIVLPAKRGDS